jgi:hypothetical protein
MKYLYKLTSLFFVAALTISNTYAACSGSDCCDVTSGVTTAPIADNCESEPESYGITLYEKYLCTARPTTPATGTAYNLSVGTTCFRTFENSTGSTIDINSTSTGASFSGSLTRPPNGLYTHGVMILKSEFRIKQDLEFVDAVTADNDGSGRFCVTTNNRGDEDDGLSLSCSATDQPAGVAGTFTAIMTSFSGSCDSYYEGNGDATFTSGDKIEAWLLNADNELASNCIESAEKDRLFGVQTFAVPVVVTKDTRGFNMAFGASSGSSIWQNGDSSYSVGSGPFKVVITPTNY